MWRGREEDRVFGIVGVKIHRGNVFPMVKFNFLAEDERKKINQKYRANRVTKQNYRRNTIDFKREDEIEQFSPVIFPFDSSSNYKIGN